MFRPHVSVADDGRRLVRTPDKTPLGIIGCCAFALQRLRTLSAHLPGQASLGGSNQDSRLASLSGISVLPIQPQYAYADFDDARRERHCRSRQKSQPVDEAEIEAIRTVIQSGIACKPYPRLRTGQRVRVEDGALQGLTGVVMKYKDDCRLIISVTLLMRAVSVEIDRSSLKPIADPLPLEEGGAADGRRGFAAPGEGLRI